jgi:hypothetical protein
VVSRHSFYHSAMVCLLCSFGSYPSNAFFLYAVFLSSARRRNGIVPATTIRPSYETVRYALQTLCNAILCADLIEALFISCFMAGCQTSAAYKIINCITAHSTLLFDDLGPFRYVWSDRALAVFAAFLSFLLCVARIAILDPK